MIDTLNHVVRLTNDELITLQDVLDAAVSEFDRDKQPPDLVRLALRLHRLTGEELPPSLRAANGGGDEPA